MTDQQNQTGNSSRIVAAFLVLCCGLVLAHGQKTSERFDPDGAFWIYGKPPTGFEDFSGINLNSKRSRRLPASGVDLTNGAKLRFQTLADKKLLRQDSDLRTSAAPES